MDSVNMAVPYWIWFIKESTQLYNQGHIGPNACTDRLHGELMTAMIDRLRLLGINTYEVTGKFAIMAAELEKHGVKLDSDIRDRMSRPYFSADDVEYLVNMAALKRLIENLKRYSAWIKDCREENYLNLRELSIHLFADIKMAVRLIQLLELDSNQVEMSVIQVQQAVRNLLANFTDYMLNDYTDFFHDFSPTAPFHLGGMLQCAAILERIGEENLLGAEELKPSPNSIHVNFPAKMYKYLLNWFNDYSETKVIKKWNFAKFTFTLQENREKVVPNFSAIELKNLISQDHKIKITIFGAEYVSLLHVQEVVDYFESTLWLKEDLEWEFLPSMCCQLDEMVTFIHIK
ncbi:hypothetical protein [Paenibacillus eucommiae]|uniref:Uncharacterized protein n=1 Tax=Paenibacillus eucommiae TaxID=1355755 RepID=A0ABS4J4P5_9BACL|nr:hypothetical protein [Paenibacillus eucommiae]MBP1994216.1 hypothetical protein [Paenibacillus eucommiae]